MLARDRYGVDVILEPSRFVAELPDEVFERWTIELRADPGGDAEEAAAGTVNERPGKAEESRSAIAELR